MRIDSQKSRVYAWERNVVAPFDKAPIHSFELIEKIVKYVWEREGLKYPPLVKEMPKQKHASGDGERTCVRFQLPTFNWIILHEVSHAMGGDIGGRNNQHGAIFMGLYIQLLSRYLKMDFQKLAASAEGCGLHVKLDARPVFLRAK